jgi:hypothetical protein
MREIDSQRFDTLQLLDISPGKLGLVSRPTCSLRIAADGEPIVPEQIPVSDIAPANNIVVLIFKTG